MLALAAFLALTCSPAAATAARPCRAITVDKTVNAKVATLRVSCRSARRVAKLYFERILAGDRFDGKTSDGRIFFSVKGFRCLTGLGGSQAYCRRRGHWVFASTKPGDNPATWRPPEN